MRRNDSFPWQLILVGKLSMVVYKPTRRRGRQSLWWSVEANKSALISIDNGFSRARRAQKATQVAGNLISISIRSQIQ